MTDMTAEDLRKSILQQAIQGKLVPQNPDEEPASVLLDRIRKEKARLVKSGKVYKKKDTTPLLVEENYPFDIPDNWRWAQLSDVSIIQEGAGIRKYQYTSSGIQLLCVTNILEGEINLEKKQLFISEQEYKNKYIHLTPQYGDIITACSGGSWGKVAIYESETTVMLNTSTLRLRFFSDLAYNKYLYYICKSDLFKKQLSEQLAGIQPNFGYAHYSRICFPLPPLAEQKRIVERIEELMAKVEKYEKSKTALDKLESDLQPNLKKSILQYAIQGKLVPQNPEDEPASVFLERIREEKARLVKEKKIKKDKNESIIFRGEDNSYYEKLADGTVKCIDEEIQFDVPKEWELARLSNICSLIDGEKKEGQYVCLDAKFLRGKSSGDYLDKGKYVSKGDNIILVDGENSGEVFTVPCNGYMGSTFKQLWTNKEMYLDYVLYYLMFYKSLLRDSKKGAAIPHLNKEIFYSLIIGIPPLAEQKRIVAALEAALSGLDKIPV